VDRAPLPIHDLRAVRALPIATRHKCLVGQRSTSNSSALDPKGLAITHEIADGLFSVNNQTSHARQFSWATPGIHGTVVEDNEPLDSARVRATAGPGLALAYHAAYEFGGDVTQLPGGQNWLEVINGQPEHERHLTVHDQHLVGLNEADEAAWAAGSW
jgi:5,10-methylenetetrahydromethanopterin reductase